MQYVIIYTHTQTNIHRSLTQIVDLQRMLDHRLGTFVRPEENEGPWNFFDPNSRQTTVQSRDAFPPQNVPGNGNYGRAAKGKDVH